MLSSRSPFFLPAAAGKECLEPLPVPKPYASPRRATKTEVRLSCKARSSRKFFDSGESLAEELFVVARSFSSKRAFLGTLIFSGVRSRKISPKKMRPAASQHKLVICGTLHVVATGPRLQKVLYLFCKLQLGRENGLVGLALGTLTVWRC